MYKRGREALSIYNALMAELEKSEKPDEKLFYYAYSDVFFTLKHKVYDNSEIFEDDLDEIRDRLAYIDSALFAITEHLSHNIGGFNDRERANTINDVIYAVVHGVLDSIEEDIEAMCLENR